MMLVSLEFLGYLNNGSSIKPLVKGKNQENSRKWLDMKETGCNIYNYADFRMYLSDYQESKRKIDKSFSRSGICRKLGLPNTRSYFNDVLKGKFLSELYIDRFIEVLKLDRDESRYFRALVHFNQSQSVKERDFLFEQLISLNKTPKRVLQKNELAFYKEWHHSVIRAMLDVCDIKDNYQFLAKKIQPSISAAKVEASITLLKELNLISKNSKGFWKRREKSLSIEPYLKSELVQQYQGKKFEQGIQAHFKKSKQPKTMATFTASMSLEIRPKVEKKIQKLFSEIRSMVNKDQQPAETVYQLNIQFFPHIKQ